MEDTFPLDLNIDVVSKHPHCFLCRYARETEREVFYLMILSIAKVMKQLSQVNVI